MRLEKLSLYNFKNYREAQLEFPGNMVCLLGKNGSGKTNLLDAIHYLSLTKSAINSSDQQTILAGENHFLVKGEFTNPTGRHQVVCSYQSGQKKMMIEDDHECGRLSSHIGKYPIVLVAPGDIELIWDGSELRRKFFDTLLSQTDKHYLENLIVYGRYLRQRNSLLRIFQERGAVDQDMLSVYDAKMVPAGEYIHRIRKRFMAEFLPRFEEHYRFISGDAGEEVKITYQSQLDESDFAQALAASLPRDTLLQRTGVGIHRDDFVFTIYGGELRRLGSQGQQKSFLIGLKLAEFETISGYLKMKPLLLLDDIFDKLDDERIEKLMMLVSGGVFGQLLITDARAGRSLEIVRAANVEADFLLVENGTLKRIHEKA